MLFRKCAGGIVFHNDSVLLLQNDKREWILPKGVIKKGSHPIEVALHRVQNEAGVQAQIIGPAGETNYEFYSFSRQKPVCNQVTWFLMQADSNDFQVAQSEGFIGGGFYPVDEALQRVTYSQDRSLVRVSYYRWQELAKIGA